MIPHKDSVVFMGRTVIDEYYTTPTFPREGEKIHLYPVDTVPGGFSNSAYVLARLGTKVFMAETLGDDAYTPVHMDLMHKDNMDTSFIRVRQGAKNNTAIIFHRDGSSEKTVFTFATDPEPMAYTDEELDQMADAGWIFGNIGDFKKKPDGEQMVQRLLAKGAKLLIDGEPASFISREADDFYFSKCSYLSLNDFAFEKFCGGDQNAVEEYLSGNPDCILVHTMAEKGCTVYTKDRAFYCPGCRVETVDTTGAGDTFNGAFLHMLMKGRSLEECAVFACAAAARCTMAHGPRAGAATQQEVFDFMQRVSYTPKIEER